MLAQERMAVPPDAQHTQLLTALFDAGVRLLLRELPSACLPPLSPPSAPSLQRRSILPHTPCYILTARTSRHARYTPPRLKALPRGRWPPPALLLPPLQS